LVALLAAECPASAIAAPPPAPAAEKAPAVSADFPPLLNAPAGPVITDMAGVMAARRRAQVAGTGTVAPLPISGGMVPPPHGPTGGMVGEIPNPAGSVTDPDKDKAP